jgi:hypothetical protein
MSGQNWHANMLRLVGSWIAKGNIDAEIRILAEKHTLPDYTLEQTWQDVQPMIEGARKRIMMPKLIATRLNKTLHQETF